MINNFLVQTFAKVHIRVTSGIATYAAQEALKLKKKKKMKGYVRWLKYQKKYESKTLWGKSLLRDSSDMLVDLSEVLSPEEAFAKREEEKLAEKLKTERLFAEKALKKLQQEELKRSKKQKAAEAAKKKALGKKKGILKYI